jgi:3-isopropylmalate dehydrogenase
VANPSILILPGDGIGPEVMAEVRKVIDWLGTNRGLVFDVSEDLVGGAAYDVHGKPLADATMDKAQAVDAVLLGAVGGPKWDDLDFSVKPERGLLRLRKEMDLYANLRPAQCFDALADFSSLKTDVVAGLDIMIVRELTSGVYFGEPRGVFTENNERVGINTQRYTEIRDRARGALGFRVGAQARQQGLLDGEGQCDGIGRAVAAGGDRGARGRISGC